MANSSTVGKELKSSGLAAFIAAISTATDRAMFSTKNTSSSAAGIGTTISTMRVRMPAGSATVDSWMALKILFIQGSSRPVPQQAGA